MSRNAVETPVTRREANKLENTYEERKTEQHEDEERTIPANGVPPFIFTFPPLSSKSTVHQGSPGFTNMEDPRTLVRQHFRRSSKSRSNRTLDPPTRGLSHLSRHYRFIVTSVMRPFCITQQRPRGLIFDDRRTSIIPLCRLHPRPRTAGRWSTSSWV